MAARYVRIGQYPDYRDEVRGTLAEILASTANPGTYAAPEDVAGCTLEMGADGKWVGTLGSLSKATTDALYASGALANLATGATYRDTSGTQYTYSAGAGWVLESSRDQFLANAYDTFRVPDGPLSVSQTGQAYLVAGDNAGALFRVIDGKAAQGIAGTPGNAYASLDAGGQIAEMSAEWTYEAPVSGDTGSPKAIVAVAITGDQTLSLGNLLHWITNLNGWYLQTRIGGSGNALNTIASGSYSSPLNADGITKYQFRMAVDTAKNRVTMILPDGSSSVSTHASVTDDIVGSRGYWQIIRHNATEAEPRFTNFALYTKDDLAPLRSGNDLSSIPIAILNSEKKIISQTLQKRTTTFTPNSTGWWRVWYSAGANVFGGSFAISSPTSLNANVTDIAIDVSISAFSNEVGSIVQTRHGYFQGGCVSQVRIGSNGSNALSLDLFISTANIPITLDISGPQSTTPYTPVVAPSTPTNFKTLNLGGGVRTSDALVGGGGVVTVTGTATMRSLLTEIDATSGDITLTLPSAAAHPGIFRIFSRIDSSANVVTIIATFTDGTASKTIPIGGSLRVVASSSGVNRWALS